MTIAFPLTWPEDMPRAKSRENGSFKTTLPSALDNVEGSLRAFSRDSGKAVTEIVMSSNVALGVKTPPDPGVAVWFKWEGEQFCIAVDRYTKVEGNLQAIHHVLEARRTELRHGTLALVRAAMRGLKALPPPAGKAWHEILGVPPTASRKEIETAFKEKARAAHPDQAGGSTTLMSELTVAKSTGLKVAEA